VALAIVAGASFVARGFAGHPDELAGLIVAGMRHPGLAFIQVLSPCITFRPEQFDWKVQVRSGPVPKNSDRAAATTVALVDDGFSLGVLFESSAPAREHQRRPHLEISVVESQFALWSRFAFSSALKAVPPCITSSHAAEAVLRPVQLIFYSVGVIVGAGVYSVIGSAAGLAQGGLWLSFLVGAGVAFLTAFSYA
jgi:hypothetical protein